jgi:hypothetical protein
MQFAETGQRELEERAQDAALRARMEGFLHTAQALEALLEELRWTRERYGLQMCNTGHEKDAEVVEESAELIYR